MNKSASGYALIIIVVAVGSLLISRSHTGTAGYLWLVAALVIFVLAILCGVSLRSKR